MIFDSNEGQTHFADDATLRRISQLEAENERFRKALEHYADTSNWIKFEAVDAWYDWYEKEQDGFVVARQALKPETKSENGSEKR